MQKNNSGFGGSVNDVWDDFQGFGDYGTNTGSSNISVVGGNKNTTLDVDLNSLDKAELFSYVFAGCDSKEEFEKILVIMNYVSALSLAGQVSRAMDDPDAYFDMMQEYAVVDDSVRFDNLDMKLGTVKVNTADGIAKVLWDAGLGALYFGLSPSKFDSSLGSLSEAKELIRDTAQFIVDVNNKKLKSMDNGFKAVVACLPRRQTANINTYKQRLEAVSSLVEQFDTGVVPTTLNPAKYSLPTEAGILLPHTLDSKEWLGVSVASLIDDQFPQSVVSFVSNDFQDIRSYSGGPDEYLMLSDDMDSPYYETVSPSLRVPKSVSGTSWPWRAQVGIAHSMTSTDIERDATLTAQRDAILKHNLRLLAESVEGRNIPNVTHGSGGGIATFKEPFFGKKFMFKFFKRGYSTRTEVELNPDYFHVVKITTSIEIGNQVYFQIALSDQQSIVLLPHSVWKFSKFFRHNPSGRFSSKFGSVQTVQFASLELFAALYRISHTFNMLKCWSRGVAYDFREHAVHLTTIITESDDKGFKKLLGAVSTNNVEKVVACIRFLTDAHVVGLWLGPGVTKSGKASLTEIQKSARFDRELYVPDNKSYSEDVWTGDDFALALGSTDDMFVDTYGPTTDH